MDYAVVVRDAIRKAREVIGDARGSELSQPDFGALVGAEMGQAGFSKQAVINWEKGRSAPDAAVLLACARVAGMGVDQLLRKASTDWIEAIHADETAAVIQQVESLRTETRTLAEMVVESQGKRFKT